ncbi:Uma2 family endonuclease [Saccharopolyspora cebuensis]|uniref:Uma2 family endonuclease n=1 Tax=Saccharopolyspora cebuensis TaxID=418759 RepID=A0ABV4CDL3_9PSEU
MVETTGPRPRPCTVADLVEMPADGRRYELLDGMLLASPPPGFRHQKVVLRLGALLDAACPDEFEVVPAPFAVRPSVTEELQPDLLVARRADLAEQHLPVAPVLVVEVLSPGSRHYDLGPKKAAYQRIGVTHYWVVDPLVPGLVVHEPGDGGEFRVTAAARGAEVFEARRPFPVRVVPAELPPRP